jgi:hypothetical protein
MQFKFVLRPSFDCSISTQIWRVNPQDFACSIGRKTGKSNKMASNAQDYQKKTYTSQVSLQSIVMFFLDVGHISLDGV